MTHYLDTPPDWLAEACDIMEDHWEDVICWRYNTRRDPQDPTRTEIVEVEVVYGWGEGKFGRKLFTPGGIIMRDGMMHPPPPRVKGD